MDVFSHTLLLPLYSKTSSFASGTFTAKVKGFYKVNTNVYTNSLGTTNANQIEVRSPSNSDIYAYVNGGATADSSSNRQSSFGVILELEVGEVIEIFTDSLDSSYTKNAILNFRSSVDSMSARILSRGLPDELSKTIQKQIGGYLTTEYQMFNKLNPLKKYKPTEETISQATRMLIKDKQRIALFKNKEAAKAAGKSIQEIDNIKLTQNEINNIITKSGEDVDVFLKKRSLDEIAEELPDGTKVPAKEQIMGKPPTKEIAKQEIDAISINPSILKDKVLRPRQELLAGKITDPRYTFSSSIGKPLLRKR